MTKPTGTERQYVVEGTILHPGSATGELLALSEPVSFWGGVSRAGIIIDRRHPQCGMSITRRAVAMASGRGSSSASSVLAEQIRAGTAPSAILLTEPDAIIVLGAAVAGEMYGTAMPVIQLTPEELVALSALPSGTSISVAATVPPPHWPPAQQESDTVTTVTVTSGTGSVSCQ